MDRYELKEELGDGSFGRVVKAQHKETGNVVSNDIAALVIIKTKGEIHMRCSNRSINR